MPITLPNFILHLGNFQWKFPAVCKIASHIQSALSFSGSFSARTCSRKTSRAPSLGLLLSVASVSWAPSRGKLAPYRTTILEKMHPLNLASLLSSVLANITNSCKCQTTQIFGTRIIFAPFAAFTVSVFQTTLVYERWSYYYYYIRAGLPGIFAQVSCGWCILAQVSQVGELFVSSILHENSLYIGVTALYTHTSLLKHIRQETGLFSRFLEFLVVKKTETPLIISTLRRVSCVLWCTRYISSKNTAY